MVRLHAACMQLEHLHAYACRCRPSAFQSLNWSQTCSGSHVYTTFSTHSCLQSICAARPCFWPTGRPPHAACHESVGGRWQVAQHSARPLAWTGPCISQQPIMWQELRQTYTGKQTHDVLLCLQHAGHLPVYMPVTSSSSPVCSGICQIQLLRCVVCQDPRKHRPLRQVIERAPGSQVEEEQVIAVAHAPALPCCSYALQPPALCLQGRNLVRLCE